MNQLIGITFGNFFTTHNWNFECKFFLGLHNVKTFLTVKWIGVLIYHRVFHIEVNVFYGKAVDLICGNSLYVWNSKPTYFLSSICVYFHRRTISHAVNWPFVPNICRMNGGTISSKTWAIITYTDLQYGICTYFLILSASLAIKLMEKPWNR